MTNITTNHAVTYTNPLVNNNSKIKALSHINLVGLIRNRREKVSLVFDMHSQKCLCLLRLPIVS